MSNPLKADIFEQGIRRARLGLWDWDLVNDECQYSDSWFAMLGYAPNELHVSSDLWLELTHPDDRTRAIESGERHILGDADEIETELRLRHKSGHWLWVLDRGGVVERDRHGRPTRVVGVQVDISRQKAVEQQLQMVNERFRTAMEASDLGLWEYHIDTKRSLWDGPTRAIFGLNPEGAEQPGAFWHCFLHPEDRERTELAHGTIGAETRAIRYRIIRLDGQVRHVETFAHLVPDPDGTARLVGSIRDITEDVKGRESLAWATSHDALTDLLTRAAFEERLERRLADTDGQPLALIYIDLDHFKEVNNTRGHPAGDLVLREVARTLLLKGKVCDVARLGGDEFALAGTLNIVEAERLSAEIVEAISKIGITHRLGKMFGASIGIAMRDHNVDSGTMLIAMANDACYSAKRNGKKGWHPSNMLFSPVRRTSLK